MYSPETGNHTKIQILEAGYKGLPSPHGHPYWSVVTDTEWLMWLTSREEIFVLEGTAYCHTAKRWIHPGEYACRPPGMVHGPFVCGDDQVRYLHEHCRFGLTPQGVKALLINTYKFGNVEEEKKPVEFGENIIIRTL